METAFELFAQNGVNFSLTEVGEMVGIKKASIYAHFENKEALIKSVIEAEMEKYYFEIDRQNNDLKKIFFGVLDYYGDSRSRLLFWKRLLLIPPIGLDDEILSKLSGFTEKRYEIVKMLVANEIKNYVIKCSDEEEISLMFFSLINGLLSSVLIYHPQDITAHYESIWNNFWRGITVR